MHGRRLAVVAAAAFPAAAGAAQAATPGKLVAKYQPVTQFDTDERFRPTTIASFVADSNLETRDVYGGWATSSASPTIATLPVGSTAICNTYPAYRPCWRLNQRTCSPSAGLSGVDCYVSAWTAPPPSSVVYGRVVSDRRAVVLQYWYFYYENFYSYRNPPDSFIWQAHEGDWEVVMKRARRALRGTSRLTPHFVGYGQPADSDAGGLGCRAGAGRIPSSGSRSVRTPATSASASTPSRPNASRSS